MVFYRKEERLTNEIIAAWSEEAAQQYVQEAGKRALSEAKIRFALEELLLKFRDTYGTGTPCRLTGKSCPARSRLSCVRQDRSRIRSHRRKSCRPPMTF